MGIQSRSDGPFPWGTLLVNCLGALLIGILLGVYSRPDEGLSQKLLIGTGFLGGFTTFSTFSYETLKLARDNSIGLAACYVLASNILCIALCGLGYWAAIRLSR